MVDPQPATTTEVFLALILEELRALRAAMERPMAVISAEPLDCLTLDGPGHLEDAPRKRRGRRPRKEIGGTIDPGLDPNVG